MKAPLSLRRPINWQDFESLCKKLWGEIWQCPEIKKNGRSGQQQNGVDIYGMPKNETHYFGIQCKGKDEYTNQQFTELEINTEIEKAKSFRPLLKKLYFTTTALKDVKIEEYIRAINLKHLANNLFEVHIFSWEDIVDLIEENRDTNNWYLNSQNYKTTKSVSVSFDNGESEITCKPDFCKPMLFYFPKDEEPLVSNALEVAGTQAYRNMIKPYRNINLSYSKINILIKNTGNDSIEEFKLRLNFDGDFQDLSNSNIRKDDPLGLLGFNEFLFLSNKDKYGVVIPFNKILVGDDSFISHDIYIKPLPKEYSLKINWSLIAKEFKDTGKLIIKFIPEIHRTSEKMYVDEIIKPYFEEMEIEDYFIK